MIKRAKIIEDFLHSTRSFFNLEALKGKSKEVQETIVWHWVRYIEHTFFSRYIDYFNSSFYNILGKNQKSPDEVIQAEIFYLKEANDFLTKLINFSPFGKQENVKQRWFNLLMLSFSRKGTR
ncbi:hypothetical protein AHMF7605_20790 [Adhaeribacter arboris]|uniref:Uncharacterized protein n=1 Tax=Adhaeribacter arboris TaxID=2072846 RepID=A0A2T2YJW5_9BACT|nr:hypothetical protein [Adhaeribacter arboris]PSR55765.1 hypothetical protein AHMF7605_20790 [Adhaeribacter arboris]